MRRVNIYAETYTCAFKRTRRVMGYVLELVDIEGNTVTTTDEWDVQESTWNEGVLKAFIRGMSRLNRPCELHMYTQNKVILDLIENNLEGWIKNGFKNSKGQPIKNAQLWEQMAAACRGHLIMLEEGVHSYYHWMQDRMIREMR